MRESYECYEEELWGEVSYESEVTISQGYPLL